MNTHIQSLLQFLDDSPCDFLAVDTMKAILEKEGYSEKKLDNNITAKAGEKFYFTKNDSAIFAIKVGQKPVS